MSRAATHRHAVASPAGCITDVAGMRVGHAQRIGRGWRTGTTVVLPPPGTVAGCDVRGGGPGTRETDLLRPEAMIDEVHAICLSGGSAYGLATAGGVMEWLEQRRTGFRVGQADGAVVPIVPAAVIFDLGRGGQFAHRPDHGFGYRAASAARARPCDQGALGAGTGALAGGIQGGVGSSSITLPSGIVVGALAVVNAAGQVIDPATALPWHGTGIGLRRPSATERAALAAHLRSLSSPAPSPLNTTIGVVATTARLGKAECHKLAAVAHDGLARAVRPAHSMFDGDTIFGLATGRDELPVVAGPGFRAAGSRMASLNEVLEAGAACFALACTLAVVEARSHPGGPPAYIDLCPSAIGGPGLHR